MPVVNLVCHYYFHSEAPFLCIIGQHVFYELLFDYNSGCFFLTNFGDFLLTRNGYNRLTLTTKKNFKILKKHLSVIVSRKRENNEYFEYVQNYLNEVEQKIYN